MFTIPNGIDPKVKKVLQDLQGILLRLDKRRYGGGSTVNTYYSSGGFNKPTTSAGSPPTSGSGGTGLPSESYGDVSIHGDLYIDGVLYGTSAASTDIDPTFADVTGSRVLGTTYHNTETTMKMVVISVELSA